MVINNLFIIQSLCGTNFDKIKKINISYIHTRRAKLASDVTFYTVKVNKLKLAVMNNFV